MVTHKVTHKEVRSWVDQAEADLAASQVAGDGVRDCHRRYWIQQSYEKSLKAYALMQWAGELTNELRNWFLHHHSPLTKMSQAKVPFSKELRMLIRNVEAFVGNLDNSSILRQIDEVVATTDPSKVSYRYPFIPVGEGDYVAPASYNGWDANLGNFVGAQSAVKHLIKAVKDEYKVFVRSPK